MIWRLFRKKKKKFVPQFPRRFVIIRWANTPETNEDLEIFSAHKKILEAYVCSDFNRPRLYDVQDYLPGMERIYEDDGFYVFDLTTGIGTSKLLTDNIVSWDINYIRR